METLRDAISEVADRLRRLPESRLNKVADRARTLAQSLADAAAGIEARAAAEPPPLRVVPVLNIFAVADQVTVTANDLAAVAGLQCPSEDIWWQGARRPLQDVLEALAGQVQELRAQV